jgi:hypothetical protein
MAFDLAHIQALEQAVQAALAALQAAQGQATQAAYDQAVAALDAAWASYYGEVLAAADKAIAAAKTGDVLGLFPVALEAKLEPAQHRLRVRVWPEPIVQSVHDPALTTVEQAAGQRYWIADAAATTDAGHLAAWTALAGKLGPQRAAWVARALTPTNLASLAPGVTPIFPQVTLEDPANPFVPTAAMLPDRWVVLGYRDDVRVVAHVGQPIVRPLVTGLDTTASALAAVRNADGSPIQLPPRMRWMADFATAVSAGMALDIPVPSSLVQIDQLYVFGVRSGGAAAGRDELEQLLTGHRYGRGLAFVPQETPTNNSPSSRSGLPTRAEAIPQAFTLERKPRAFTTMRSNGKQAASALGIAPEVLASTPFSGAVSRIYMEPDGFEPEISRAMQMVLWMPVLGHFFEDLVGLDAARLDALRNHYLDNVSAAGPVPAIRIGDQPYGILPVTAVHSFHGTATEHLDPILAPFVQTIPTLSKGSPRITLTSNYLGDLLNFTGRPRTFIEVQLAPGNPSFSTWGSAAAWLSQRSNGAIPSTWVDGPLENLDGYWNLPASTTLATIDGVPTRPLSDAGTPAALGSLATTRPDAIRAGAPQSSVLTRIARYATLLEWALFARTVGEAALQGTQFLDGARAAASANRALWLDLLLYAFNPVGTPPFPVDTPACQKIVNLVASLDAPPRTCPGQPRLAAFRVALQFLAQVPAGRLDSFAYSVLSLGETRHDAWQTSLAVARLNTLRKTAASGIVAGGFGWLQDVRAASALPAFIAEFIHAPSHDHAATAAVLRSAAVRAGSAGSDHADIDLSSRRVRLAHWLVNGVRNGRQLKELLGARFERHLKDRNGGALLPQLRRDFPGGLASGILDGLALRAARPPITDDAFVAALAELDDSFDALADALTAEAVYQIVRGNPAAALTAIDDVSRGETPPELEVTESPKLGTRLTFRVAAVVPARQAAPGWPVVHTPRGDADPILDAWCGHVFGPAAATVLTVDGTGPGGGALAVPVGLDRLGIAAIDVVAAAASAGAELTQRLLAQARAMQPALIGGTIRTDTPWKDLLRLCTRIARLIARAEPLTSDALAMPGTPSSASGGSGDLPARVTAAQSRLQALSNALAAPGAPAALLREAAGFGIVLPGVAFDAPLTAGDQHALAAAVRGRLAAATARAEPRDTLRALVGEGVLGIVAVAPPDASVLATAAALPPTNFTVSAAGCAAWLEAMARVRPALTRLGDVMAMTEISGRTSGPPLRIAQAPWVTNDPWIGLGWSNPRTKAPAQGRLSLVLHAPAGVDPSQELGGFLIDAWADAVPPQKRDTALAVRHNGPDTRAPQTMLVAVAPDTTAATWSSEMLVACLRDLLDAVVIRQGVLATPLVSRPVIHLGRRTDGVGISFDGAELAT